MRGLSARRVWPGTVARSLLYPVPFLPAAPARGESHISARRTSALRRRGSLVDQRLGRVGPTLPLRCPCRRTSLASPALVAIANRTEAYGARPQLGRSAPGRQLPLRRRQLSSGW